METNNFRKILSHMYEVQKIIYETKKCERIRCESCKTCDYNNICEATSKLLSVITREA